MFTPLIARQHGDGEPLLSKMRVPVCGCLTEVRGSHRTWRPNFCQGFPPISQILKKNGPLLPPPGPKSLPCPLPCARGRVGWGVGLSKPCGQNISGGSPLVDKFPIFWARFHLHRSAQLYPTSGGIHPWVSTVRWGWGRGAHFGTTGVWSTSCPNRGIPARLTKVAWQGGVF